MAFVAPSVLSIDFVRIKDDIKMVEEAGAGLIHIDIMDGHFVPNLTLGPKFVASLKEMTPLPLDVHLMVKNPRSFIPLFQDAGADWMSIHPEASFHLHKDISLIKEFKMKAGLALNPATPIHLMNDIIKELDFVLMLAVNLGFEEQSFIESCHAKLSQLKNWIRGQKLKIPVEIEGGVTVDNIEQLTKEGADILVADSAIFDAENPREVLVQMVDLAGRIKS